jgi:hypothetical protein
MVRGFRLLNLTQTPKVNLNFTKKLTLLQNVEFGCI